MGRTVAFLATLMMVSLLAVSAQAGLIDRGGGLVYDNDLDITWLQDANYSGITWAWGSAKTWGPKTWSTQAMTTGGCLFPMKIALATAAPGARWGICTIQSWGMWQAGWTTQAPL